MILKDQSKPAPLGGVVAGEAVFGSTAVRPNAALRGARGAARASAAAPPGASRRALLAAERRQTRMLRKVASEQMRVM